MISINDLVVKQAIDRRAMKRIYGGALIWEGIVRTDLTGYELINGMWNKVEKSVTLRVEELYGRKIYTPVNNAMTFWV